MAFSNSPTKELPDHDEFCIAKVCALTCENNPVEAAFDKPWDSKGVQEDTKSTMTHKLSSSHESSTKAHNGSSHSRSSSHTSSRSFGSSRSQPHKYSFHSCKETVERYVQEERDYKSYAVKDYDLCQEAAKRKHSKILRDVVRRV
jgi:hypothetical protein